VSTRHHSGSLAAAESNTYSDDDEDNDDDDVDIDGADGGNIGCRLMSAQPSTDDEFTDLIVNGLSSFSASCLRHCHCICLNKCSLNASPDTPTLDISRHVTNQSI